MKFLLMFLFSYILVGELSWLIVGNRDLRPDLSYIIPLYCGLVIGYLLRVER